MQTFPFQRGNADYGQSAFVLWMWWLSRAGTVHCNSAGSVWKTSWVCWTSRQWRVCHCWQVFSSFHDVFHTGSDDLQCMVLDFETTTSQCKCILFIMCISSLKWKRLQYATDLFRQVNIRILLRLCIHCTCMLARTCTQHNTHTWRKPRRCKWFDSYIWKG